MDMSTLDPAVALELAAVSRQKPMLEVINLGDSPVQQFYSDTVVFVTGGSGFLGKQLIEKLFRSCKLTKLYLLIRQKGDKSIQERFENMLKDPVFFALNKRQPRFADRIVPIEGDLAEHNLGISDEAWSSIAKEVNIIFHLAANVKFDEPLKTATHINVNGTMKIIELAKDCKQLKQLIYVSSAYSHATEEKIGKEVLDDFYPTPMSPSLIVQMVQTTDEERLNKITPELLKGWPNTHTFTKAIAEEVIRRAGAELPVCIVRPAMVCPCYYEPRPGWLDMGGIVGLSGIILGAALGIIHVFLVNAKTRLAAVPLDYVNNAIIGAAWDSVERKKEGNNDIPVYTVGNEESLVKWELIGEKLGKECWNSPLAAWYCYLLETKNKLVYLFLTWYLHYIPAYILDGICTLLGKKPQGIGSFVKVYNTIDEKAAAYNYFTTNEFLFRDKNVKDMLKRMSVNDRAIFNCDLSDIDFAEYTKIWSIGIRKYILRDGLKDSLVSFNRQKIFRIVNYVFIFIYTYAIWFILRSLFSILKFVLF